VKNIEYDSFIREKKEKFFAARALLGRRRGARRRVRDAAEREALMQMDCQRLEKWLREGTLELVAPRHYVLKLSPEDFGKPGDS
jgi:hypothetical protein